MSDGNQELQDKIEQITFWYNNELSPTLGEKGMFELIHNLNTSLKTEQANNATYKKALQDISEWQDVSDSQDAIHAANTAIEALAKGEGK